jgi:hypothetical protein
LRAYLCVPTWFCLREVTAFVGRSWVYPVIGVSGVVDQ